MCFVEVKKMSFTDFMDRMGQLEGTMLNFNNELASLKNGASGKVCTPEPKTPLQILEQNFAEFCLTVFNFFSEVRGLLENQESRLDDAEQYSRRNCVIIHNLPESKDEDLYDKVEKLCKDKLEVEVDKRYLDRVHRLYTRRIRTAADVVANGARPVIVKFSHYHKREEVFRNKKKLKGTNISVTESLTQYRLQVLKECKDKFGRQNVWTMDGKIVVLGKDKKHYVTRREHINNIPVETVYPSKKIITRLQSKQLNTNT